ncbi:MAG TPA: alpha/beta hydrolase [Flavobacterium sp.]
MKKCRKKMQEMNFQKAAAFLLALTMVSCGTSYRNVTTNRGDHKIYNVAYGHDEQQVMDVFIPAKVSKDAGFAIIIHGGAWSFGNKRNIRMTQKFLMKNGIPSANINYRLVNDKSHLDEQIADIASVIKLLDRDLPKNGLNPKKYTLIGESSGGHLALLYGYTHPEVTNKIIALFPPTDFIAKEGQNKVVQKISLPIMKNLLGGDETIPSDTITKALKKASPVYNTSNVPTLLFQGTWDFIVNKRQSIILDSVLAAKKIPHKLIMVERGTHFMRLNSTTRNRIIYPEMLRWIEDKKTK